MLDSVRPAPDPARTRAAIASLGKLPEKRGTQGPVTSLTASALSDGPKEREAARPSALQALRDARVWSSLALGVGAALALSLGFSESGRARLPSESVVLYGAPSVKHTPAGGAVRWRQRSTTVHIDSSVDALGPMARDAIRGAFGTWLETESNLPNLSFVNAQGLSATIKPDGKNTVVYAPITVPGHERDLAITLTYSDEETGDILEADIVINASYPYALLEAVEETPPVGPLRERPSEPARGPREAGAPHHGEVRSESSEAPFHPHVASALRSEQRSSCVAQRDSCDRDIYDLENVMTHEAGHFFGLGEDLNDTSATMYLCTNRCETHKRKLTAADTAVLAALYAGGFPEAPESAGCAVSASALGSSVDGARPATTAAFLSAFLALFSARRRR